MKKVAYDDYYLNKNYFGNPYPGLVDFFRQYQPKGTVLDLGCGQGRDALFLGELGYKAIGLLDSMLHFYKRDVEKETEFVKGILTQLKRRWDVCELYLKGAKREKVLK